MSTETLLRERNQTHGDFAHDAFVAQTIKNLIYQTHTNHGRSMLTDVQCQALDMIASKLGRIAAGDPHHRDHWDDIAGYAKLAAKALPGETRVEKHHIIGGLSAKLVRVLQAVIEHQDFADTKPYLQVEQSPYVDAGVDSFELYVVVPCQG